MKPITHSAITTLALDVLQPTFDFNDAERSALLLGAVVEDNKTLERGLNWHFYPANQTIAANRWFLKPTSLQILKKREQALQRYVEAGEQEQIYKTLGRILHHIQDMNTPTHVVPAYHSGGSKADPFEIFLVEKWDRIHPYLQMENQTASNLSLSKTFSELYTACGKKLLQKLDDGQGLFPLQNKENHELISSDKFWLKFGQEEGRRFNAPLGIKGFGSFGDYGFTFNDESLDAIFDRYKVATFFMNMALNDTIDTIRLFRDTMN